MKTAKPADLDVAAILDGIKFVCECGEGFSSAVWHCLRCGEHSDIGRRCCQRCEHEPWRPGATVRKHRPTKAHSTPE